MVWYGKNTEEVVTKYTKSGLGKPLLGLDFTYSSLEKSHKWFGKLKVVWNFLDKKVVWENFQTTMCEIQTPMFEIQTPNKKRKSPKPPGGLSEKVMSDGGLDLCPNQQIVVWSKPPWYDNIFLM